MYLFYDLKSNPTVVDTTFKYLIVSLVPLKVLLWQKLIFCLFQLASYVNLL